VFLGEYQHSVDDKGRVVMPSKFRDRLAEGLVLTKGQDDCLFVFTPDRWEEEVAKLRGLPRTKGNIRTFARALFGSASDQQLDKQGRLQIPPALRAYAKLDKDVVVLGVGDRVEIWDKDEWASESAKADAFYSDITEALDEQGGI
jgi:MraZ protein